MKAYILLFFFIVQSGVNRWAPSHVALRFKEKKKKEKKSFCLNSYFSFPLNLRLLIIKKKMHSEWNEWHFYWPSSRHSAQRIWSLFSSFFKPLGLLIKKTEKFFLFCNKKAMRLFAELSFDSFLFCSLQLPTEKTVIRRWGGQVRAGES